MQSFKPRETLSEQVARHLENMIAFEQLSSGDRIHESNMAKELDVSHGAVREALLMLEKRHLVRNVPRKGAFVTTLDEDFVRSLYEANESVSGPHGAQARPPVGNRGYGAPGITVPKHVRVLP